MCNNELKIKYVKHIKKKLSLPFIKNKATTMNILGYYIKHVYRRREWVRELAGIKQAGIRSQEREPGGRERGGSGS